MTEQTNTYFRALEQASGESTLTDGKHRAYIAWFNSFRNQSSAFEVDDLPWPREIHELWKPSGPPGLPSSRSPTAALA